MSPEAALLRLVSEASRLDYDPEVGELEPQAIHGLVVPLVDQSTEFVRERGPACG
jgi:hypothetical protein